MTRDHVNVQLRHHVAERGDVHLVGIRELLKRNGDAFDFCEQRVAMLRGNFVKVAQPFEPRHENAPRKSRVVVEQQIAQRQVTDAERIGGETGMQFESHGVVPLETGPATMSGGFSKINAGKINAERSC